jgi:type I restriction enzyme S subunit
MYDKYKNSIMPWFPLMPSHWNIMRGKNLYAKENRPVRQRDEVVTCFRDGMVTLRKNRRMTGFTESTQWSGYQGVRRGDLVIHVMDAFAGAIGVSDSDGKSTPVYNVCTAKCDLNNVYYAYVLREMALKGFIQSLYRGIRERSSDFRYEVFASQFFPLPPREEQDQIVRFLDWKVSRINKLINAKKKQIALLKEQHEAVIQNVFNNISAKIVPCRHLAIFQNGISESGSFFVDGKYPFVNYSDVYKNDVLPHALKGTVKSNKKQQSVYSVLEGDVFFTRTSETLDEVGLTSICFETLEKAVFSGFLIRMRPKQGVLDKNYSRYYFRSKNVRDYFTQEMNSVIRASLGQNLLKNLPVILPSLSEQKVIAERLNCYTSKFDKLMIFIEKEMALLQEYRTRLISDVVTGKMDVRNIVVPEYEVAENIGSEDDKLNGLSDNRQESSDSISELED